LACCGAGHNVIADALRALGYSPLTAALVGRWNDVAI